MGYFDGLVSSTFKTTADRRRLFFPFGILSRGYLIASDSEFEQLRRQVKAFYIVSLPLTIVAVNWNRLSAIATALVLTVGYAIWARSRCRGLHQTGEKMTMSESLAGGAHALGTVTLWVLEVATLFLVASCALVLLISPEEWLFATTGIAFFGLAALISTRMLIFAMRGTDVK